MFIARHKKPLHFNFEHIIQVIVGMFKTTNIQQFFTCLLRCEMSGFFLLYFNNPFFVSIEIPWQISNSNIFNGVKYEVFEMPRKCLQKFDKMILHLMNFITNFTKILSPNHKCSPFFFQIKYVFLVCLKGKIIQFINKLLKIQRSMVFSNGKSKVKRFQRAHLMAYEFL